jgi:hypothetical protein
MPFAPALHHPALSGGGPLAQPAVFLLCYFCSMPSIAKVWTHTCRQLRAQRILLGVPCFDRVHAFEWSFISFCRHSRVTACAWWRALFLCLIALRCSLFVRVLDWVGGNGRLAGRRVCTASGHAIVVAALTIFRIRLQLAGGNNCHQDDQPE